MSNKTNDIWNENLAEIKEGAFSNDGKSECCIAEIGISGGGYDGEDIVSISEWCKKCGTLSPKVIRGEICGYYVGSERCADKKVKGGDFCRFHSDNLPF